MKDGFIKVACCTPRLKVADVTYNVGEIRSLLSSCFEQKVKIAVFPELAITSYTVSDLVFHDVLLDAAEKGLSSLLSFTEGHDTLVFVGLPIRRNDRIYNVAAVLQNGKLLALVPKTHLPNYNEFYEKRHFAPAPITNEKITFCGQETVFGKNVLFSCAEMPELIVAAEICEDLWAPDSPSVAHTAAGATVVANLSASNELVGKADYRRSLISIQSAKLFCAYLYADCGKEESTTDLVFAGHNLIAENGKILAESELFTYGVTSSEIDLSSLVYERRKCFDRDPVPFEYEKISFSLVVEKTVLTRTYPRLPFVPAIDTEGEKRLELILSMQAHALAKRLIHVRSSCAVVGISGGLDSALALLVAVRAKELLPNDQKATFTVYGITMPCFGTTDRTLKNARKLTTALGAKCVKISIRTSVNRHFIDIKHKPGTFDVTYENAQARERTQVLMDYANERNGLVVGTGDLSELALGWATYNGDHMSMYGVNGSVPKTLVKHLVRYEGKRLGGVVNSTLADILDTPISPELLPTDGKEIVQVTEDKVGPYELHDFFLFHFMRYGADPVKIYRLAKHVFADTYSSEVIKKWLRTFLWRFFTQQFKRSCVPDGVKIGSVALSPRGDLRMPSDACVTEWIQRLEECDDE